MTVAHWITIAGMVLGLFFTIIGFFITRTFISIDKNQNNLYKLIDKLQLEIAKLGERLARLEGEHSRNHRGEGA